MKTSHFRVCGITFIALLSASVAWAAGEPQTSGPARLQQRVQTIDEMSADCQRECGPVDDLAAHPAAVQDRQQDREQTQQRLNRQAGEASTRLPARKLRFGAGYESRMGGGWR